MYRILGLSNIQIPIVVFGSDCQPREKSLYIMKLEYEAVDC